MGNPTTNLIPAEARARLNIRFNPNHTGQSLADWIADEAIAAQEGFQGNIIVKPTISGEAFLTEPGDFTQLISSAVTAVAGSPPDLSTTGGTSDARFIRALCPVVEVGLVGKTMHSVDERTPVSEILQLQAVYREIIRSYFVTFSKAG